MIDGHNGCKISKNREWEIFVTLKKNFFEFFNFDIKYLKNAPEKFLQFLAKSTKSRVENTNMTENQNRSSFRRHFGVKTNF